jgi:hypothetical protein
MVLDLLHYLWLVARLLLLLYSDCYVDSGVSIQAELQL